MIHHRFDQVTVISSTFSQELVNIVCEWPLTNPNWHTKSCYTIPHNKNGHHHFWTKVGNACHSDAAVREFNKTCFLHAHNWMPNSPCRAQLSTHNNWPPLLIHSTKKTCLEVISSIIAKLDMAKKSNWKMFLPFGYPQSIRFHVCKWKISAISSFAILGDMAFGY